MAQGSGEPPTAGGLPAIAADHLQARAGRGRLGPPAGPPLASAPSAAGRSAPRARRRGRCQRDRDDGRPLQDHAHTPPRAPALRAPPPSVRRSNWPGLHKTQGDLCLQASNPARPVRGWPPRSAGQPSCPRSAARRQTYVRFDLPNYGPHFHQFPGVSSSCAMRTLCSHALSPNVR